jgi:5-methylcytosine-specific restriction endonuclease McrA
VKLLRPSIKVADISIARVPPKQADPFYLSIDWKAKRGQVFERDRYTCVVPGCGRPAKVCEHIVSRRDGGSDDNTNLCSLCRDHDNHFKENAQGVRANLEEWRRIFGRG